MARTYQSMVQFFISKVLAKILVPILAIWGKYPWWLVTPDDPVSPFGQYEPTVRKIYEKYGRYIGDVYWLAWRNSGFGYSYKLKPDWLKDPTLLYKDIEIRREGNVIYLQDLKETTRKIGPIYLITGHRLSPILNAHLEEKTREKEGLSPIGRPLKHPNMDGRPIMTIRTKKTL